MTSQTRAIRSESKKIVKFVKFRLLISFNFGGTCDLIDVPAFYDVSGSCNLLSKAEMRQFGASGNQHI